MFLLLLILKFTGVASLIIFLCVLLLEHFGSSDYLCFLILWILLFLMFFVLFLLVLVFLGSSFAVFFILSLRFTSFFMYVALIDYLAYVDAVTDYIVCRFFCVLLFWYV